MLLFCLKTIVKVTQIWTSPSEKGGGGGGGGGEAEEEEDFSRLVTFWLGTFVCFLVPLGFLFIMKTLEDEM